LLAAVNRRRRSADNGAGERRAEPCLRAVIDPLNS
jgi:hypothetical protein